MVGALDERSAGNQKKKTNKKRHCFCGKPLKNTLVFCFGPNCAYEWFHMKCGGLKEIPAEDERVFCSDKCKEDDRVLAEYNRKIDEEAKAQERNDCDPYEYCSCKREIGGDMVKCSGRDCEFKWYHLECANLEKIPEKSWYCEACKQKAKERKRANPSQSRSRGRTVKPVKKRKIQEEEYNILEEHIVDLTDIPDPEITQEDVKNATDRDNELRGQRKECRGLISHNAEHWLKLAKSKIHGRGLFAIKNFAPDVCLLDYAGERIDQDEADRREIQYKKEGIFSIYFYKLPDKKTIIDSTKSGNYARFVNQSCRPNVRVKTRKVNGVDTLFYYTTAHIFKGDELTIDYKFQFEEDEPRIPCKCGLGSCGKWLDR